MPIPTSRSELLDAIEGNFSKLFKDLETIPATRCHETTLEGHAKGTMMSVHNLVSYLVGWNHLVSVEQRLCGQLAFAPMALDRLDGLTGRGAPGKQHDKKTPQPSQDLADVVAATTENGEDRIAPGTFEWAARQAPVGFHVADLRLDRAASSQLRFQPLRQAAAHAGNQHLRVTDIVTAVTAVDDCERGSPVGERLDLLQGLGQGVAVAGPGPINPAFPV